MKPSVVTRFAPSPTGDYHLGSARTTLFAWAFAKHHGGQCLLRMEDTDRSRSTQTSEDNILASMAWLGLTFDGPMVRQSERMPLYQEHLTHLLKQGVLYVCDCTPERLDALRADQLAQGLTPRYDGCCRHRGLSTDHAKPYVLRFAMPTEGFVGWDDGVHGALSFDLAGLDDWVVQRSDGSPTYNFTVVVDDWTTGVTHVLRGDDHINNTPKQCLLYDALGAQAPTFVHLPTLLSPDGKRYSKRHGARSVAEYRADGYVPEALLNTLVRMGWSHGDDEVFSLDDIVAAFTLDGIQKSPARFNPDKLDWLNQTWIQRMALGRLREHLDPWLTHTSWSTLNTERALSLLDLIRPRATRLTDLDAMARRFLTPPALDTSFLETMKGLDASMPGCFERLQGVLHGCQKITAWHNDTLDELLRSVVQDHGVRFPAVAKPLRLALLGTLASPSIHACLDWMGQEEVVSRLQSALDAMAHVDSLKTGSL